MSCSLPPFHAPPSMDHFDVSMEAPKSASFGAMGSLLRKLDELVHIEVDGACGLRDDLGSISTKLAKLSEVDDPSLTMNYWMKDVRELSYDLEDCVNQFIYSRSPDAKMVWISNLLGFRSRLEEVRERYDRYNLEYSLKHSTTTVRHRFPTVYREPTPVSPVGMERLRNQLHLQIEPKSDDENNVQLKVVSILGVEGVGKSMLAQKLWHELGGQFKCKAFVQTAKQPDMRIILKNILSQIRPRQMPEACQLVPNLIHDIRKHLQDKRYFIIIDDLWAVSVWDVLSRCFPEGNHCSRIITTTTIDDVALASCSYDPEHIFQLEPLGADHSYQLFISRVFGSGKGCPQQFSEVSADITKKCGGLPLAIICIATLVASQPETIEHWEFVRSILHHNLRTSSSFPEILKLVLKLCYSTLPHCLKTCLLYLSAYPENYIFMKDDLVEQWIAEDFICTMDGMDLVEVASRYFDELLSLGLIQQMDTNSKKKGLSYVVHPTVFDFIMCKSMEDNFITILDYSQSTVVLTDKIRRLSLHFGSATYATQPASIDVSQVRSLTFIGLLNCMPSLAEFRLVQILILHLRSDDGATKFSLAEICELLLLRYMQVRCNVVVQLPHHIQYLKHLEILEINARVAAIPSDTVHIRKLSKLCLGERKNFKHLTLSHVASGKAVSLDDFSSEPTPRLQILEFLPPICITSRLPVWIYKLRRLCILEIVVRELRTEDISVLGELPALTALSLYVRIPTAGPVVFRKEMFPVLEYFKFVSGVLLLDFREEAMPNLRRLKLGFNAHKGEQYGDMLAGIQHLLNLQKIVASIGAATDAEEFDRSAAWSAFNNAIIMHPCQKSFKVKRVDRIDEEYDPSKKQCRSQESVSEQDDVPEEPFVTQKEGLSTEQLLIMPAEYTEKHADISGPKKSSIPPWSRFNLPQRPPVESPTWYLAFRNPLHLPIFTGSEIKDKTGNPLEIILVNISTGLPSALQQALHIELVPLSGDFAQDNCEDWSADEFHRSIVKQREGKQPLLTGDIHFTMRDGRVIVNNLRFTDNSSWVRCRRFRIGVRVVPGSYDGSRIVEAMTEAFEVMDGPWIVKVIKSFPLFRAHRGELYRKRHPPFLGDDVWRLEKIGENGAFHRKLMLHDVETVQDFLRMLCVKPHELRTILGDGMTDRMWVAVITHARTCVLDNKVYAYSAAHGTIYVNSVFDPLKVEIDGVECPLRQLDRAQTMFVRQLILEAYEHRHNLQEVEAAMFHGHATTNIPLLHRVAGAEHAALQAPVKLDSQPFVDNEIPVMVDPEWLRAGPAGSDDEDEAVACPWDDNDAFLATGR